MHAIQPHQLILFGPPGTSKSWRARNTEAQKLNIADLAPDIVPVTFHPEYSYGEFVARLLPLTRKGQIEYSVHAGPFLRALALAQFHLSQATTPDSATRVVLLIDEINRGNCAEIFGDVFQLLDREDNGWSSYSVSTSRLQDEALAAELDRLQCEKLHQELVADREQRRLRLPPNLFLIATMNTSDDSVYFMDAAFKRRWNFTFCPEGFDGVPDWQSTAQMASRSGLQWSKFLEKLNEFIRNDCTAPRLDDKLVGPWFIKARSIRTTFTLAQQYAKEWGALGNLAAKVAKAYTGTTSSKMFDEKLVKLITQLSPAAQKAAFAVAQYDANAIRKFRRIDANPSHNANGYYYAESTYNKPADAFTIERFLRELGNTPLPEEHHKIDRADIVGKLLLYLWDNVFDRDRAPLWKRLGLQDKDLRTFGQFADRVELFIDRVVDPDGKEKAELPDPGMQPTA